MDGFDIRVYDAEKKIVLQRKIDVMTFHKIRTHFSFFIIRLLINRISENSINNEIFRVYVHIETDKS